MSLLNVLRRRVAQLLFFRHGVPPPAKPEGYLDPRSMLGPNAVEDLATTAEEYFRRIADIDDLLAKPFSRIDEVPRLLKNFSILVEGMDLSPGMTVLDFAAGSCWASRFFTQLGCTAVALEVSPTALSIGRRLYERLPVIGDRPVPRFLLFDGRTIDLPDRSVDRIFCFDAFHHVPNPGEVLSEMARVLVDGGIAAFAEPGPFHSHTAQSQFEMKNFNVLENDLDIDDVWHAASAAGFTHIRMAVSHAAPFHLSLPEFKDFLAGAMPAVAYVQFARSENQAVRNFFLVKGETRARDSRRTEGLQAELEVQLDATTIAAGALMRGHATVANTGQATWLASNTAVGGVSIGCHLHAASGTLIDFDYYWAALTVPGADLLPGQRVEVPLTIPAPPPGSYELEFDLVSRDVCWFAQTSASRPIRIRIDVVY
jgi:SAM-dependent methyltransferase